MSRIDDELDRLEQIGQLQLNAKINAAKAVGSGTLFCIECDNEIPEARRKCNPSAERCVGCQEIHEFIQKRDAR